jgi:predicted ester cyclase
MSVPAVGELYARWMALWNGDLSIAEEIVAPGCIVHSPPSSSSSTSFRGPSGIRQMVEMGRSLFHEMTFDIEVGPVARDDLLAARWMSEGVYAGGIPGASAPPGTTVEYHGMDLMRIDSGKIVEYWVSADVYHLMAQLGAV